MNKDEGMNYIAEISAFERWLETSSLAPAAQLLWYKLMYLSNRAGNGRAWQEWVTVDNFRLMSLIGAGSEKTLIRAREQLTENGIIEFKKGKKGAPNKYKVVSFYCKNYSTNDGINDGTNGGTNAGKTPVQTTDIYKHKQEHKQNYLKESKEKNCQPTADPFSSDSPKPKIDYGKILDAYNSITKDLPKVVKMTDKRKKALNILLSMFSESDITRLFTLAQESDFLKGINDRGWICSFDWLINCNNAVKVLEGNYTKSSAGQVSKQGQHKSKFVNYEQREMTEDKYRDIEKAIRDKEFERLNQD